MKPFIGQVVVYNTTEADRNKLKAISIVAGAGGSNSDQKQVPAMVTAVWGELCVNLKVIPDSPGELWVTSAIKGEAERNWMESGVIAKEATDVAEEVLPETTNEVLPETTETLPVDPEPENTAPHVD